tara:strand:+ start:9154 stop:9435 length:282 start_codon:yes stop_codon:yes gene_type:complete
MFLKKNEESLKDVVAYNYDTIYDGGGFYIAKGYQKIVESYLDFWGECTESGQCRTSWTRGDSCYFSGGDSYESCLMACRKHKNILLEILCADV